MPIFGFRAFDGGGSLVEGHVEAPSQSAAYDMVRSRGLTPFEILDGRNSLEKWWQRDLFASGKPSRRAIAAFTRDLATLLQARIALAEALTVVVGQSSDRTIRNVVEPLRANVLKGLALSDCLAAAGSFGEDYVSVVRAGEASGKLAEVFSELAALHERRNEIDGKIKSALIYPAVLVVMAALSIGVIVTVLVPNIAPIFIENGRPLPPFIAAVLVAQANVATEMAVFVLVAFLVAIARQVVARSAALRARWHAAKLRLPILGSLLLGLETARFSRTLGTLMQSGVPIMSGFASATSGVTNVHVRRSLAIALDQVRNGTTLAAALKREGVLPALAVQMIALGEEAGQLPQLLLRVALLFEEQGRRGTERLMSLLTPALTVSVALIVGALIMAVMSAILGINDLATQ